MATNLETLVEQTRQAIEQIKKDRDAAEEQRRELDQKVAQYDHQHA